MGLQDLLGGGAGGMVNEISGQPDTEDGTPFPTKINFDHHVESYGDGDTITCQPGTFTPLIRFRVPAGVKYAWGSGAAKHEANQGYIYVDLQHDSDGDGTYEQAAGTLRIKQESQTGRNSLVVADLDADALDGSKNNRKQQQPFPEQDDFPFVTQDSYMVVEYQPPNNSAEDIDPNQSEHRVPATEYDLTTN